MGKSADGVGESHYKAAALYWMGHWMNALLDKKFEEAREYFRIANQWKRRAGIQGMLDQVCEPMNEGSDVSKNS